MNARPDLLSRGPLRWNPLRWSPLPWGHLPRGDAPSDIPDGVPPDLDGPGSPSPVKPAVLPAVEPSQDRRTRHARRYRILVHNDDVTPMDFVVEVLTGVHRLGVEHAIEVMFEAHRTGCALVRVLGLEEAEFRVQRSHSLARQNGFPLTFSVEPE